jgi:hypothetical protein
VSRPAAAGLDRVLSGSFRAHYTARVFRGWGGRSLVDVPLSAGKLNFDATKEVCGSGSATLAFADAAGRSRAPVRIGDSLSPFNNWLEVTCHIRAGRYRSSTVLGRFMIGRPRPDRQSKMRLHSSSRTLAESITVQLDDAFLGTKSEPIDGVLQSTPGRLMRDELAELLGLPVAAADNARVGALIEYPEDRLAAAFDLVQLVGGEPYMRWDGAVGIRPNAWPSRSFTLHDGAYAGAPGVPVSSVVVDEWEAADVPNRVVVLAEDPDQRTLRAEKRIEQGPMRYGPVREGAWGRRTKTYKVDSFTSQEQVDAYCRERFAVDTVTRAVGVTIEMPLDPRLEPGDVGQLWSETISARIRVKDVDLTIGSSRMKVSAYLG